MQTSNLPQTSCLYYKSRPVSPCAMGKAGVATVPVVASTTQVKKDCGLPWWIWLLLGLIVLLLVWAWYKNRELQRAKTNTAVVVNPVDIQSPPSPISPIVTSNNVIVPSPVIFAPRMGRQEPALEQLGNSQVQIGRSQTIRDLASQSRDALFMFTNSECPSCEFTIPEFEKAAKYINIPVYEIPKSNLDTTDYPSGWPYIFLLSSDGRRIPFSYDIRSSRNIVEFVRQNLGDRAVNHQYQNDLPIYDY